MTFNGCLSENLLLSLVETSIPIRDKLQATRMHGAVRYSASCKAQSMFEFEFGALSIWCWELDVQLQTWNSLFMIHFGSMLFDGTDPQRKYTSCVCVCLFFGADI